MTRQILIVSPYHFGELADNYYWAKYALANNVNVTYFGYSGITQQLDNVNIKGVPHSSNKFKLFFSFYKCLFKEIKLNNHQNIIFCYWKFCFLLPLFFPTKNIVLDIRTSSVTPNNFRRYCFNLGIRFSSLFFKKITVISPGVSTIIKINPKKSIILPVGAEVLSDIDKVFSENLNLFYIGIFNQRRIVDTLIGFSKFISTITPNSKYDIVGFGSKEEENLIKNTIIKYNLSGKVFLHGKKTHYEALTFFNTCNVGISYVPIMKYFDSQPPTKTFEYILSGLTVIATNTSSNRALINSFNGVLIDDNSESFFEGLVQIYKNRFTYNSSIIRKSGELYSWDNIITQFFLPIFFQK